MTYSLMYSGVFSSPVDGATTYFLVLNCIAYWQSLRGFFKSDNNKYDKNSVDKGCYDPSCLSVCRGVARNLFWRGQNWLDVWGTENPLRGPGVEPRWGSARVAPISWRHTGWPKKFGTVYSVRLNFIDINRFLLCDAMRCTVFVIVILSVRLSVCLTHLCTVSTWFDLRSWFLDHMVAPSF